MDGETTLPLSPDQTVFDLLPDGYVWQEADGGEFFIDRYVIRGI